MNSRPLARLLGVLGLVVAATVAACSEDIDASGTCPLLCPPQNVLLRDTLVEGVSFDSTLNDFPGIGLETALLLANLDSLDTRVVIRFDSLFSSFRGDTAITRLDSATLALRLVYPPLTTPVPITVEAYDVDTTAADTVPLSLLPLFRPDRLLATELVAPSSVPDSTVRIHLNTAKVLARVRDSTHLRIGLRVRAGTKGQVAFVSAEGGTSPVLSLRTSPDTSIKPIVATPTSSTPPGTAIPARQFLDYVVVATQPGAAPAGALAVGGLRGHRSFLRFSLPQKIVDSSTVVRATLELTQLPYRGPGSTDTTLMFAHGTLGSSVVTDVRRIVSLINPGTTDSTSFFPADSGLRQIELASLVRAWGATKLDTTLRSIVLRLPNERATASELRFVSVRSPNVALRPRIRLIYSPRSSSGLP